MAGSSIFKIECILVFFVLFVQLVSSSNATFASASASTEEATALLKWKKSLQNNLPKLSSWTSVLNSPTNSSANTNRTSSPCTWFGISCNPAGSVIRMNLTRSGLQGMLHAFSFSSFPNLAYVDLSENLIFGTIPPQISFLSKLIYLDLSANQLSGKIPPEMGNLFNLVELGISSNLLTGPIPPSFGNLTKLTVVYLFNNSLSGHIPPEIRNLKSLSQLALEQNHLDGSIPASLGELGNLTLLYLFGNNLSGSIPEEIGNLESINDLELSRNRLHGSVPASFANLSNLQYLFLRDNQLSGPIPQGLGDLMNLVWLELDENQFTGFLPENICHGGSLQEIAANNNHFIGRVPKSLKNCTSLVRLRLEGNGFVGDISDDFGFYPNLQSIHLSDNKFYGRISKNWGQCPQLKALEFRGNDITGSIPPEIGMCSQLQVLDLSLNSIVGQIPKELTRLTSLVKLMLNGNQLSGAVPLEFGSLTNLEYLDLSSNKLLQSIPTTLGDLFKLHELNLSHNNFSDRLPVHLGSLSHISKLDLSFNSLFGEIPAELSKMQSLERLNLSHNHLSGVIPIDFEKMNWLLYVDISYNELQGPIPNSSAFLDAPIEALKGNKGLCGNVAGLQPCKNISKRDHKLVFVIAFPLLGALFFTFACFQIFLRMQRREKDPESEESDVDEALTSVSTFDGRTLYKEVIKATESFDARYCIGQGGHGSVYKAELSSGHIVAVKKLHARHEGEIRLQKEFLSEIRTLTETRHRNIVKLHGFCSHSRHSFLVYEYLERGSLAIILGSEDAAEVLDWRKRLNIIKGVAYALSYMHHDCSPPIIHRDIKSGNILLDSRYEAHISDFGTAKLLKLDSSNWTTLAGTYGYIAPVEANYAHDFSGLVSPNCTFLVRCFPEVAYRSHLPDAPCPLP
ncbi:hypothetical protein CJ030_MR4G023695 [Morella rubra]|uniref:non-specific serine/threonine protein kinase n=1 Tax=Morella rubra TaxID=262757 RepID=A0A6A1VUS7_9ROSI|nr:hypothetical protein CJ030_MR4G023695 [Morella rubra]